MAGGKRHNRKAGCSIDRKPRVPTAIVNPPEDMVIVLGAPVDGVVALLDGKTGGPIAEGILQTGISYARGEKSPKLLTVGSERRSRIEFDPDRKLLDFDHVFAVDTNTDPTTGRSVTVIAGLTGLAFEHDSRTVTIGFLPARVWCSPLAQPERSGWHLAIGRFIRTFNGTVAVFVDSDLGKLDALNARREPILGEFLLPPDYQLFYAAGDRGTTEYIGNFALGKCDRVAARIMKLSAGHSDPRGWFDVDVSDELVDG